MAFLSLIARLGLDSTGFQIGIKKAGAQAGIFSNQVKGAIAGAFGTAAIAAWTRSAVRNASAIRDQADALGLSTDRLQEIRYAADQTGASMENVSAAMRSIARAQAEAIQRPDGDAAKAFERLGVSGERLRSMNFQQLFEAIAKQLEGGANNTNLMSAAMSVMGKNASSVLPMMFDGLSGLTEEARNLGQVLSEDVVDSLDSIGDEFDRLKGRATNVFSGALSAAIRFGGDVLTAFGAGAAGVGRYVGTVAEGMAQGRDMKEVEQEARVAFASAFDEVAEKEIAADEAARQKRERRRDARERAGLELPDIAIADAARPRSAGGGRGADVNALQRIGAQIGAEQKTETLLRQQLSAQEAIKRATMQTADNTRDAGGGIP